MFYMLRKIFEDSLSLDLILINYQYCWCLGGLRDAEDLGIGVQGPAARLEGLEEPGRQAPQGCEVCHRSEGSVEYQEPHVEASKEAPEPAYGTIRGI